MSAIEVDRVVINNNEEKLIDNKNESKEEKVINVNSIINNDDTGSVSREEKKVAIATSVSNVSSKREAFIKTLPLTVFETPLALQEKNPHPRDSNIWFDEKPHKYYIWDEQIEAPVNNLTSVTTFVHKFVPVFDADTVIDKMMKGANWNNLNKYWGMTKEQIKKQWDKTRDDAASTGTKMHRCIELFYNGIYSGAIGAGASDSGGGGGTETKQFEYFLQFHRNEVLKNKWTPFRTEWRIWCEKLKITGTIDMIFIPNPNKPKQVIIYDWKCTKKIDKFNNFKKMNKPFHQFDDCNFNHYSLQLNLYKYLLEKHYDVEVIKMYLGIFHPDADGPQIFPLTAEMQEPLREALQMRMKELEKLAVATATAVTATSSNSH